MFKLSCCCKNEPYYISAYGLAVQRGYKGTLEEWLDSLGAYIHIRYSDSYPESDEDMRKDIPGDWLGICVSKNPQPSEHFTDYKWQFVNGAGDSQNLAPFYDRKPYSVNDMISMGHNIYRCIVDIPVAEPFNPAHWEKTTLAEALIAAGFTTGVSYEEEQALTARQKLIARINIEAMPSHDGVIDEGKLAVNAVTVNKIAPGAVTTDKLANKSITANKIANRTITNEQLAENSVNMFHIAPGAVGTNELYPEAVTSAEIADGAVNGTKLNLSAGDLPLITLVSGRHYFASADQLPSNPAVGRIAFVKRG